MSNINFIELTMEEWESTFKPIVNHLDENASFQNEDGDGIMFETYDEELQFVKEQGANYIWTYGTGDDGGSYIWNNYHFVNRLGYFITEVPWIEGNVYQIKVSDPWYCCEGCGAEMEDPDNLINDRYSEFDKCPECATIEEIEKLEETQ